MKKLLVAFIVLFSLILTGCEATPADVVQESAKELLTNNWEDLRSNYQGEIPLIENFITEEEILNTDDLSNLFRSKYDTCGRKKILCQRFYNYENGLEVETYGMGIMEQWINPTFQEFKYVTIDDVDYLKILFKSNTKQQNVYINPENKEQFCYSKGEYTYYFTYYFKYDDEGVLRTGDGVQGSYENVEPNQKTTYEYNRESLVCKPLKSS